MKKIFVLVTFILLSFNSLSQQEDYFWVKLGNGVQYSVTNNKEGNNIFIGIGGWNAREEWVNNWLEQLYSAKLKKLKVQHLFSVKGPDDACYKDKEINLNGLADYIQNILKSNYFQDEVIIAAHSSGSFVAHELFKILYGNDGIANDSNYYNKINYFNLDGGIGSERCGTELTNDLAQKLNKIYAVAVFDSISGIHSQNLESMEKAVEIFGNKSELIIIKEFNTGCFTPWCLHDAVINKKPHNPEKFDLEKDYGIINSDHPVQTDYLDVMIKQQNEADDSENLRTF